MKTSTKNLLRVLGGCFILAMIFYGMFFQPKVYRQSRIALGPINVDITLVARTGRRAGAAFDAAYDEIARINDLMSAHISKSEISRLNNSAGEEIVVSPETAEVLRRSIQTSEMTGGAFDVTAGAIIALWKDAIKSGTLPSAEDLDTAQKKTGYRRVVVSGNNVRFEKPGMRVDLGGIAKGYAVDRAVAVLKAHGIKHAIVDAGGDGYALGTAPGGKPWILGVQNPSLENDEAMPGTRLLLVDKGYATSGDYRQFTIVNGERYSHIVDPRTGRTAKSSASVTVVAPDCTTADAMATAISVLGEKDGVAVCEKMKNVECLIITRNGESSFSIVYSKNMSGFLKASPPPRAEPNQKK